MFGGLGHEWLVPPHVASWPDEKDTVAKPTVQSSSASSIISSIRTPPTTTRRLGIPYPGGPINVRGVQGGIDPLQRNGSVALNNPPLNPYARITNSPLVDLIELHDSGEPIIWPKGHNITSAKQYVDDYMSAVDVAYLYTPARWIPPASVH